MNQEQLEIARLNASLAVARSELKRPNTRHNTNWEALWVVAGLGLGVGLGFLFGFSSVGAEQFIRQEFGQLSSAALGLLR